MTFKIDVVERRVLFGLIAIGSSILYRLADGMADHVAVWKLNCMHFAVHLIPIGVVRVTWLCCKRALDMTNIGEKEFRF